jgi:hypothetical protein
VLGPSCALRLHMPPELGVQPLGRVSRQRIPLDEVTPVWWTAVPSHLPTLSHNLATAGYALLLLKKSPLLPKTSIEIRTNG